MDNKEPQNCWEFWNCPEVARKKCPAYEYKMGRECWMIASSFNGEGCPKTKGMGMKFCMNNCDWFKKLNPDLSK